MFAPDAAQSTISLHGLRLTTALGDFSNASSDPLIRDTVYLDTRSTRSILRLSIPANVSHAHSQVISSYGAAFESPAAGMYREYGI